MIYSCDMRPRLSGATRVKVKSASVGLVLHFPASCPESSWGLVSFPVDLKLWVWDVRIQNWSVCSLCGSRCSCFWIHLLKAGGVFQSMKIAFFMVYASSGQLNCFGCGDVGHKRVTCPHMKQGRRGPQTHLWLNGGQLCSPQGGGCSLSGAKAVADACPVPL